MCWIFHTAGQHPGHLRRLDGGPIAPPIRQQGVDELREISRLLDSAGFDDGRIAIDPTVVRGLDTIRARSRRSS